MTENEQDELAIRKTLMKEAAELVGSISLLAAVLGVVGAFLGWRASSAYFVCFGLTPGWRSISVIDLLMIGWVEILVVLILIS
jgi:hypothetical protein